jgi:hypothetical protein
MLTLWGEGGYGGSPNGEAGKKDVLISTGRARGKPRLRKNPLEVLESSGYYTAIVF